MLITVASLAPSAACEPMEPMRGHKNVVLATAFLIIEIIAFVTKMETVASNTSAVGSAIIVACQVGEIFLTTVVMMKPLNHIWLIPTEFVP